MRTHAAARSTARVASPGRTGAGPSGARARGRASSPATGPIVIDVADALELQRTAGNAAVTSALQGQAFSTATATPAKRPLLMRGSHGRQVEILQQKLNALAADPALKVDGEFGKKTHDAVVAFQRQHFPGEEKEWDGKVGSRTWAAIDEAYPVPEIDADEEALGKKVVEGMDRVNSRRTDEGGVYYPTEYQKRHPEKYTSEMDYGFADPTYFDRTARLRWMLKPMMSASAAIRSWLDGPTVADCNTAIVAIEYETLRAAVGNEAFDREFGSTDEETPPERRMEIRTGPDSPLRRKFMKTTEATARHAGGDKGARGEPGNRPVVPGEWYYFYNHPRYLLKHPAGAWQGENSVYMGVEDGVQKWAGFGTRNEAHTSSHVTESELLVSMRKAYDAERSAGDLEALAAIAAANEGTLPPDMHPRADENGPGYRDKLNGPEDITAAEPYTINVKGLREDTEPRRGGFDPGSGKELDPVRVKLLREGLPTE